MVVGIEKKKTNLMKLVANAFSTFARADIHAYAMYTRYTHMLRRLPAFPDIAADIYKTYIL